MIKKMIKDLKNNKLFQGFVITLATATILRLFVFDVISVSNDLLQPHFFPGDFLLISKLSKIEVGHWVVLKNYPQKGTYSIRKLIHQQSGQGWLVADPETNEKAFIGRQQLVGKAALILWSLPCRPSSVMSGQCQDKIYRYLSPIK